MCARCERWLSSQRLCEVGLINLQLTGEKTRATGSHSAEKWGCLDSEPRSPSSSRLYPIYRHGGNWSEFSPSPVTPSPQIKNKPLPRSFSHPRLQGCPPSHRWGRSAKQGPGFGGSPVQTWLLDSQFAGCCPQTPNQAAWLRQPGRVCRTPRPCLPGPYIQSSLIRQTWGLDQDSSAPCASSFSCSVSP